MKSKQKWFIGFLLVTGFFFASESFAFELKNPESTVIESSFVDDWDDDSSFQFHFCVWFQVACHHEPVSLIKVFLTPFARQASSRGPPVLNSQFYE